MPLETTDSQVDHRTEAEVRLRAAMAGLPLTLREDPQDAWRRRFVVVASETRRMAISESLALLFAGDGPPPTMHDALAAFARGDNEVKYIDRHGHENTLVLWTPEMESWL